MKALTDGAPGITLYINAASTVENSSITALGYFQHPVTSSELAAFGLDNGNYFAALFGGSNGPDQMWYTDPADSRWGNLYDAYPQISPVIATLSVQSATITEITSQPQIIAKQTFTNSLSTPVTVQAGTTMEVSTTSETNWSSSMSYEVGQTITYDLSFLGSGAGGETSFSFSEEFGQGGSQSNTSTLGQNMAVQVVLAGGETVVAELTASQGTMNVELVYQLTLTGGCFGTFNDSCVFRSS